MDDQRATLQRALDALNSICIKSPESAGARPDRGSRKPDSISPKLRVSEQIAKPDGIPPPDPAEWREPFDRWLDSICVRDRRCWGGVGCLHIAFCEWAIAQNDVPCTRFTFECLLRELGFLIDEIAGVVLVCGVTFREDLESALSWRT
jgi:hypothetical protein